jgi:hypothetical protein
VDLREFITGAAPPPTVSADAVELADALARGVRRIVPARDAPLDAGIRQGLEELGLFALEALGEGGGAALSYALALARIAEAHPGVARLVAGHRAAAATGALPPGAIGHVAARARLTVCGGGGGPERLQVSGSALIQVPPNLVHWILVPWTPEPGARRWIPVPGPPLRASAVDASATALRVEVPPVDAEARAASASVDPLGAVDLIGQLLGQLAAGHRIAAEFIETRVVLRQPLRASERVQAWHAEHERGLAALRGLLAQAARCAEGAGPAAELPFLRCGAARLALQLASSELQLLGGTGYMRDSGFPAIYEGVLRLVEAYRPEELDDEQLVEHLAGGRRASPAAQPPWVARLGAEAWRLVEARRAAGAPPGAIAPRLIDEVVQRFGFACDPQGGAGRAAEDAA